jgi:hypothetical protein
MPISKIRSWLSCEPGIGDCTSEARRTRRKEFLIKKYSELRTLGLCGEYFFTRNPEVPKN